MADNILSLLITNIIPETEEAATFVLKEINGVKISYLAGQFLTFIFTKNDHEIRRSYSMSSTPGIDEQIQVTVKRVHNGEISRLLLDNYQAGDILTAMSPAGMFIQDESNHIEKDIFLLAAGSGITPVFSLLQEILYHQPSASVKLLYQNHSEESTIFRKKLENLVALFPGRFVWMDFVSTPASHEHTLRRLNNEQLELIVPDIMQYAADKATFFICGPPSFMRMCQFTLLLMGFSESQLKKEFFVIDPAPPPPLIVNPQRRSVIIHAKNRHISFTTEYPQTILQSALDQHIALPYSCRGGRCSACVAKCISGEVIMSMNDVLTDKDMQNGLVLTCVGYAATDITLEYVNG